MTYIRLRRFLLRDLNDLISCRTNSKYVFRWFHYMLYNAINNGFLAYISKSRAIVIIRWKSVMTIFWMMFLNWALDKILRQWLSFYQRISRKSLLNFIDSCHWLIEFDRITWFMNNLNGFLSQSNYLRRPQTLNWVPHLFYLRVN